MVGFGRVCSAAMAWWVRCWRRQPLIATSPAGAAMRSRMPLMSPPAQKAAPWPVTHHGADRIVAGDAVEQRDEVGAHRVVDGVAHLRAG